MRPLDRELHDLPKPTILTGLLSQVPLWLRVNDQYFSHFASHSGAWPAE